MARLSHKQLGFRTNQDYYQVNFILYSKDKEPIAAMDCEFWSLPKNTQDIWDDYNRQIEDDKDYLNEQNLYTKPVEYAIVLTPNKTLLFDKNGNLLEDITDKYLNDLGFPLFDNYWRKKHENGEDVYVFKDTYLGVNYAAFKKNGVSDSRKIKDTEMRKVYLGTIPTGRYFNLQGKDWKVIENKHGDTVVCEMIGSGKIKEFNTVTMVNLYNSIFDSCKIKDMKNLTLEQERELVGKAYNIAVRKLEQIQSGIYTEDDLDDYTIKELKLLTDQFPYGISAQKDLLYLCIKLGWIKEDIVSDSRKIKDENTQDVLDGVLFVAFEDGTEDEMIAEVNKHKNESGKIGGVQYETYDTDSSDGVAMVDLCAVTGDANGFVKALLNEWGITDNVVDLEFQASDEMKETVSDSVRVKDSYDEFIGLHLDEFRKAIGYNVWFLPLNNPNYDDYATFRFEPNKYDENGVTNHIYVETDKDGVITKIEEKRVEPFSDSKVKDDLEDDYDLTRYYIYVDGEIVAEDIDDEYDAIKMAEDMVANGEKNVDVEAHNYFFYEGTQDIDGYDIQLVWSSDKGYINDSKKVSDMTSPSRLRGYAEKMRAKRRNKNDEPTDEPLNEKQDVADSVVAHYYVDYNQDPYKLAQRIARKGTVSVNSRHQRMHEENVNEDTVFHVYNDGVYKYNDFMTKYGVQDSQKVQDTWDNGLDYKPFVVFEDDVVVDEFDDENEAIDFAINYDAEHEHDTNVEVVYSDSTGVCGETLWSSEWKDERDSWGVL